MVFVDSFNIIINSTTLLQFNPQPYALVGLVLVVIITGYEIFKFKQKRKQNETK